MQHKSLEILLENLALMLTVTQRKVKHLTTLWSDHFGNISDKGVTEMKDTISMSIPQL